MNVLRLALQVYEDRKLPDSTIIREDYLMYDTIVNILDKHSREETVAVETIDTLDFNENENLSGDETERIYDILNELPIESCESGSDYHPSPKKPNVAISFAKRKEAVVYWMNEGGKKRRSLSSVQKNFRFVKSERELYRWKNEVSENQNEKMNSLSSKLLDCFTEVREKGYSVSDNRLRSWAIDLASKIGLTRFNASATWITGFKQSNRIRSRKITKFISKKHQER